MSAPGSCGSTPQRAVPAPSGICLDDNSRKTADCAPASGSAGVSAKFLLYYPTENMHSLSLGTQPATSIGGITQLRNFQSNLLGQAQDNLSGSSARKNIAVLSTSKLANQNYPKVDKLIQFVNTPFR